MAEASIGVSENVNRSWKTQARGSPAEHKETRRCFQVSIWAGVGVAITVNSTSASTRSQASASFMTQAASYASR